MSSSGSAITVCVPVYAGAAFVAETLTSILGQSFQDVRVLISVDGSPDDSASVCRRFSADPRVTVVEQERRLGWVDNYNWLVARVRTPYFCIVPHDDLIDPEYIERLLCCAGTPPAAAVTFSDIRTFGTGGEHLIVQPSIAGRPLTRALAFLVEHYCAVAVRGVIRTEAARRAGPIPRNRHGDFAADTVWLMKLAKHGDLVRHAHPLYAKRYHDNSVHAEWSLRSRDDSLAAWTDHCVEMAAQALQADSRLRHQVLMLQAAVLRLLSTELISSFTAIDGLTAIERERSFTTFRDALAGLVGRDRLALLEDSLGRQGAQLELRDAPPLSPDIRASDFWLTITDRPAAVPAGEPFVVTVELRNGSGVWLASHGPHPVHLSYHWCAPDGQAAAVGGRRTVLHVGPHDTTRLDMIVDAPPDPGSYSLRVSIVQEGLRWYDEPVPEMPRECDIEVHAQ